MKSSNGLTIAIRYLSKSYGKGQDDFYTGTEAIEIPTVETLRNILMEYVTAKRKGGLVLRYGSADRNPKDPFVKKIGKDLALSRLELNNEIHLTLTNIYIVDDGSIFSAFFNFQGFGFGLTENKVIYTGFNA